MDRYKLGMFVVMLLSIATKVSFVRGGISVHYNGNNYVECPSGSYQVEFSSNCTDNCPPNAPFTVFDLCLDFCPVGLSYTCNRLNTINKTAATQPGQTAVKRCPKGFCPKERPFCFDYRCLSDCPDEMVKEDFSCVYHCSNTTSMVYNKSCVTECPQNYPYNELGICVSKCSPYNILYGNVCVRDCPGNMFRFNKTCVTSCPSQAPFHFEAVNTKVCLESCPDFSFIDRLVCKLKCPEGLDFLWNRTCVKTCPDSAPIIYVLNKRVPQFKIPICITNCPDDTFFDGLSCVETCDRHMYVYNSTCVDHCPASHSLVEGNTSPFYCVSQCQNNENLNGNRCTAGCPSNKLVFNRTCVSECPIASPLVVNQECFSKCPYNLLNESGTCVKHCSVGRFIFNASCVETCPETHGYILNGECYKSCPFNNMLLWNNSCFYSCPNQAIYIFNHTCLSVCPHSHPFTKSVRTLHWSFDLKYYCVASCSDRVGPASLRYKIKCNCSPHLFSYNSTCVEKCPMPYSFVYKGECLKRCPNNLVVYNNTCRTLCPNRNVLYESNCIEKCPEDKPLTYKKEDNGKYLFVCVNICPGTTFTTGKNCYDQCPEHLASYVTNRTCLEQCPKHSRFRYQFRTNGNDFAYRCKPSCDKYIFDRTNCVDVCPRNTPFVFGQTCVPKCPATHMFHEEQENLCLIACKPPLVELNNTCRRSCPTNFPFVMNNTCVDKCPEQLNMTSASAQGHVCVRVCKYPLLRENNICVQACTKFIVNNVCEDIIGCPNEYKYIAKTSRGKECRKICQENEFVFKDVQCTKTCPKFSVGNYCVENCPDTHPYKVKPTYFKKHSTCYSTCPKFTHENFCVDNCPYSYLELKSNRTCVKECPSSDPIKTYKECHRTCPGSTVLSGENTCIYKFECDSSKGLYIYDSKCVTQCPSGTFLNQLDNSCSPMPSSDIIIMTVLAVVGISCLFGAYLIFRRKPFCQHRSKINNVEQADTGDEYLTSQIHATDDAVGNECDDLTLEMHNDSSGNGQNSPTTQLNDSSMCEHDTLPKGAEGSSLMYTNDTLPKGAEGSSLMYPNDTSPKGVDDGSLMYTIDSSPKGAEGGSLNYKQVTTPKGVVDDSSKFKHETHLDIEIVDDSLRFEHETPQLEIVDDSSHC